MVLCSIDLRAHTSDPASAACKEGSSDSATGTPSSTNRLGAARPFTTKMLSFSNTSDLTGAVSSSARFCSSAPAFSNCGTVKQQARDGHIGMAAKTPLA